MPTQTTNYDLFKPLVADAVDEDLWGGYLNDNMDSIDTLLKRGIAYVKNSITLDYTVVDSDSKKFILADASGGNIIITLPTAASVEDGFTVAVKNVGASGTVTLDGNGSEQIDGQTTLGLATQYDAVVLVSDGVNKWNTQSRSQRSGLLTRTYYTTGTGNFTIPAGITKVRTTIYGAGGGGHGADGNICTQAGTGGLSSVTYNAVTVTANGGVGGIFCTTNLPANALAVATNGDLNILGGGNVGGNSGTNGNNAVKDGEPGALAIKDWTTVPGQNMGYVVGAAGTKLEAIPGMATDGAAGCIIFEY